MRQAFEKWATVHWKEKEPKSMNWLALDKDNSKYEYLYYPVECAWLGWQAALAAPAASPTVSFELLTEQDVAEAYQSAPNWHSVLSSLECKAVKILQRSVAASSAGEPAAQRWMCPSCCNMNYASDALCVNCKYPRTIPARATAAAASTPLREQIEVLRKEWSRQLDLERNVSIRWALDRCIKGLTEVLAAPPATERGVRGLAEIALWLDDNLSNEEGYGFERRVELMQKAFGMAIRQAALSAAAQPTDKEVGK
jgi:hypothetical protein